MPPASAPRLRRATPPRPCSRRSPAPPPPRCSSRRAWSRRGPPDGTAAMSVKALFFDVFGTLVDFRTGVAREAESILGAAGHKLDWGAFADAWRKEYQPALEEVRAGRMAFRKLDLLHRENLDRILPRFGISGLAGEGRRRPSTLSRGSASPGGATPGGAGPGQGAFPAGLGSKPAHSRCCPIPPAATIFPGTRSWARKSRATTSPSRASTSAHAR